MGCVSSKRVEATVAANVYRPPPTSVSLFDVSKIEEPWVITRVTTEADEQEDEEEDDIKTQDKKPQTLIPLAILEKLDSVELAPKSWLEVSKTLEELKPTLNTQKLEEKNPQVIKKASNPNNSLTTVKKAESHHEESPTSIGYYRPVKDNSFIVRDREEREKKNGGDQGERKWRPRDPFEGYEEKKVPGNERGVVLYTTTLRGVRRTFEDCETARRVVEGVALDAGVEVDERDVSLHGEYLKEVKEMIGEEVVVPRLFIMGRYIGGVEEVVQLGEVGKLREMMRWVARRGEGGGKGGRRDCEGCGGARFVPCLECNGSCKVVVVVEEEEEKEKVVRCGECVYGLKGSVYQCFA
ncbi:putative glutaredoxin, Thioredoxin-like superfamily [Dioscorea sansibarensis]